MRYSRHVLISSFLALGAWWFSQSSREYEVREEVTPPPRVAEKKPSTPTPPPPKPEVVTYHQLAQEMTHALRASEPQVHDLVQSRGTVIRTRQILGQSVDSEPRRILLAMADVCDAAASYSESSLRRWQRDTGTSNNEFFRQRAEQEFPIKIGEFVARLGPLLDRLQAIPLQSRDAPQQSSALALVKETRTARNRADSEAKLRELHGIVSEVFHDGSVLTLLEPVFTRDRLARSGLGPATVQHEPGTKDVFIAGLVNTTEGDRVTVKALPAKPWKDYRARPGRVLEQWVAATKQTPGTP